MKIVKIKITRRQELVSGLFLKEGENWVLIEENPVDYVLDGKNLINKKFIKSVSEPFAEGDFEYNVFKNKINLDTVNQFSNLNLNTKELFLFLNERKKLIGLELESSNYSLVGRINKINEKSFVLDMFGIKGKFLKEVNIPFSIIRRIIIDTDYLISIENYLKIQPFN